MRMFISYSRDDARWAKRFEKRLKPLTGDGGVHLWRDDRIPVGADWRAEIDRGLAEADAGLLLVSPNFLASDFILRKELPYLIERHRRGTLRLFCVLLKDCLFEATPLAALQCAHPHDAPLADLDDDACQTAMMAIARKIRAASQDRTSAGALPVDVKALPSSIDPLVGRDSELDDLDAVLADDVIRIATLEAWGGVGKSALVEGWLNRLVGEDYRGLSRVYGYSFYRQGLEGGASSDEFFEKAFDFFGEPKPRPIPADARGRRLAQRVLDARTLLILDGLEPLQAPEGGKLLDPAMRALLVALANARPGPGLCLITTRLQVPMLQKRVGATVQRFKLGRLTESDGVALLRKRGADGHEKDLRWAVGEAKGHALTLKLVGTFVKRRLKGDIRRAAEVDLLRPDPDGVPRAARVLDAYARVLRDRLAGDVVRLLGLFDQPASADCVDALRDAPVIPGLTDQLVDALDGDWQEALTELRELGLLLDDADGALDAHPLVRAHAAARLEREVPEAWRMGHLRLYEHLTETAAHRPDTKEGLLPLYQAVVHGCRAGRVQEACDAVYYERIRRGGEAYSVKKLGLFGLDLTALAAFFEAPFTRPHGSLTAADQAWLLSQAGYTLRALGRLEESEAPMRAGLAMGEAQEAWKAAATRAGNLSELNVTLGALDQALADAERSVELADRSGDAFERMVNRTTLADAHHQRGEVASALALFEEAEAMQADRQPSAPRLYSIQGYQYCDLLLADGDASSARAVIERADYMLDWARTSAVSSVLCNATANLSLARAWTILAHRSDADSPDASQQARTHLDRAVEGLRAAGTEHHLPRGLLARAAFSRLIDRNDTAADRDLQEVEDLADRCGMRLFACDAHLERARLLRDLSTDDNAREQARPHIEMAKALIAETGYHRRDRELANLERWLSGEVIPKDVLGVWG